jgi:hypothetical protein
MSLVSAILGIRHRRRLERRYAAAIPVIRRAALAGDPSCQAPGSES